MDKSEESAPLTMAEIEEIVEKDRLLIESVKRECAKAPEVIREAERSNRRLRQIIRQLART
jgi:hypothetical protein